MRIIFILLFTTQIGCASFWISFGSHIAGDWVAEEYKKMNTEDGCTKEKENEME